MSRGTTYTLVTLLVLGLVTSAVGVRGQVDPHVAPMDAGGTPIGDGAIIVYHPAPGDVTPSQTPLVSVGFDPPIREGCDTDTGYCAKLIINGDDVLAWYGGGAFSSSSRIDVQVVSYFALREGHQELTAVYTDTQGDEHRSSWNFTVDPSYRPERAGGVGLIQIVIWSSVLFGTAVVGLAVTFLYLRGARGMTLEKIYARYPIRREVFTIYLPVALGIAGALLALAILPPRFTGNPFLVEQVLVAGAVVGLGPLALDANRSIRRRLRSEEAFAQFLFEMADSLRGGIDPIKTMKEMARTQRGLLRGPLRAASDQLRMGKPFEQALATLARRLDSPLVERYSGLLAEAATVGGDIAPVVYRAAKDMDELVKLELERTRQMKTPVMTMYIAFGVLVMMVASMLDFAPSLGSIDVSAMMGGEGGRSVPKMPPDALEGRFMHLVLLNAAGAGLLVGSFTQGKLRFGLVHALLLLVVSAAVFPFLAPGEI